MCGIQLSLKLELYFQVTLRNDLKIHSNEHISRYLDEKTNLQDSWKGSLKLVHGKINNTWEHRQDLKAKGNEHN